MLWKLLQRTFNGGQLDKRLGGRTDIAKYFQGASVLKNFIVKRQGCIVKRRGTKWLKKVQAKDGTDKIDSARLIPFSYERSAGYVIALLGSESGGVCARIYSKDGTLKKILTNMPYTMYDFAHINVAQSGDMLYMAHLSYPFARIVRKTDTDWVYEVIDFETCGLPASKIPAAPQIASVTKVPADKWTSEGAEETIYYVATAVKDGIESPMSDAFKVSYFTPWPAQCVMEIKIKAQSPKPDYYNIYKKQFTGFGFIGSTATGAYRTGEAAVTTLGVDKGLTRAFTNRWYYEAVSEGAGKVGRTGSVTQAVETACLAGSGIYTIQYSAAVEMDNLYLLPGYVWYMGSGYDKSGDLNSTRYYIELLPCKAATIGCVVTYSDDTTADLGKVGVPNNIKEEIKDNSIKGNPYEQATGSAINDKRVSMSRNTPLKWIIQNRGTKKVSKVVFTAYKDDGSIATGDISNAIFQSGGAVLWPTIKNNPFVISGYWATKSVMASADKIVDKPITPDLSITPPNYEPHFNDISKYPGCVAVYQQRLALARTLEQPFTVFMSCVGDLYNFNTHDTLREDDALEITLPATKYPDINQMVLNRDLILFCDSGEWIVSPLSGNSLTYKSISTKTQSQLGCSHEIAPIVVGDDVIFLNSTNENLTAIKYSYATDGYEATDLSILSQDIFRGNSITSMAYKQHPDSIIVVTLEDGTLATLEYMKEQEVVAWSHHELGGGRKALYCCADGSVTDGTTDIYILAQTADGSRTDLLITKADSPLKTKEDAVSLDMLSSTKIEQKMIEVALDDGTKVYGYPFESEFVSVKPEPNSTETARFEIKNPTKVEVSVTEGSDFTVGQLGMKREHDRTIKVADYGDHDVSVNLAGANNRDGRIRIASNNPWPLTILSLATTYQIEQADREPEKGE